MANFDPNNYLINLQGKKYLQVAHRVLWFKTEHPDGDGAITTELVSVDPFPIVKAFIHVKGDIVATGYGTAQVKEKSVYRGRELEKAETAAIGRALANAGYGTQFSEMFDDDSDGDLADSPVSGKSQKAPATNGNSKVTPTPAFPDVAAKNKFVDHWGATDNLSEDELKAALNVEYFQHYAGTLAQANDAVQVYLLGKVPFGATK